MINGGFFALAAEPGRSTAPLATGDIIDLAIVATGVVALLVGLFLTARASRARRALAAERAAMPPSVTAPSLVLPVPAPQLTPARAAEIAAPVVPDVPHAVRPELELVRTFAKLLATQRLSSERDRAAFMHHALIAAADALTERLDPSTLARPAASASHVVFAPAISQAAMAQARPPSTPQPSSLTPLPSPSFIDSFSPTPVPALAYSASTTVPDAATATPMSRQDAVSAAHTTTPTPVPTALPPELVPTPLRPPPPEPVSMPPIPLSHRVAAPRPLAVTTPPPEAPSIRVPAAPLLPQMTVALGPELSTLRASDPALVMGDPFSSRPAPRPSAVPASSQAAPSSRRSRRPPPGGRLIGDDLLSDLFDLMHGLSFFESALEGAEFVLASTLEEIPCRVALCHFYDSARRDFILVRGSGAGHERLLLGRTPARETLIEAALLSRRPAIVSLEDGDPRLRGTRWSKLETPPRCLAIVPVMSGVRFLALLELCDPTHGGTFAQGDEHALAYVAEQLALFLGEKGLVLDDKTLRASLSSAPPLTAKIAVS